MTRFRGEESRFRPRSGFQCGETIDTDGRKFWISMWGDNDTGNLPDGCGKRLEFSCRDGSCGVLVGDELAAGKADDEEEAVDPFFFDEGYTLAGRTGFMVWAASRLTIEALLWPQPTSDSPALTKWQRSITKGAHVLELGSGIGVVGTSLAAAGAEVLLTDLPTLVDNATYQNLKRNETTNTIEECPPWLQRADAVRIQRGWAGAMALDWTRPLKEQIPVEQRESIDVVVASDCVWLVSMFEALLQTVAAIFESSRNSPKLLLSFQRRDPKEDNDDAKFTSVDRVLATVRARNWTIDCVAWRHVKINNKDETEEPKEVFAFEISPEMADSC